MDPFTEEDLNASFAQFKEALCVFARPLPDDEAVTGLQTARAALDAAFAEHQHTVADAYRTAIG